MMLFLHNPFSFAKIKEKLFYMLMSENNFDEDETILVLTYVDVLQVLHPTSSGPVSSSSSINLLHHIAHRCTFCR
ncbi:hypothetical protein GIB67_013510 [Kingdonia uniflora]|uniref:Uncharacterized protein n=1 Tax=Kingdonia uniflora TaxID=39325 RepID=A0A7J7KUR9_9MAGN|nr:hypothetical protein GIB67_013510 [Kingdonia uniflora]